VVHFYSLPRQSKTNPKLVEALYAAVGSAGLIYGSLKAEVANPNKLPQWEDVQPFIETIPYVAGAAGFEARPCDTFFDSNAWAIAEQSTTNHPLLRQVAQWIIDESSR
jgi:hypothetical protein